MAVRLQFRQIDLLPLERYRALLGGARMEQALVRAAELRGRLAGRVVWNVSSADIGGGVGEMVRGLVAYALGAGVDARWVVIDGTPAFFRVCKRLHDALYGSAGDGSPLGEDERRIYEQVSGENAAELVPMVRPRDVMVLHDPHTAGLVPALAGRGARVIWRCHVGRERIDAEAERGWRFLAPYLGDAAAYVFSRAAYVPPQLDASRAAIITPNLDPFSPKNQPLADEVVHGILRRSGLICGRRDGTPCPFVREDGTPGRVDRLADVVRADVAPSWGAPLVVQVSPWDRLKDPAGVLRGFARIDAAAARGAHLVLAGPDVRTVVDDPGAVSVYDATVAAWRALPDEVRARVHVASLPTAEADENAAIVNALQRHAAVVVQKSLQEGFGLTVTEAMWKARPVVASAVGGMREQIDDGVHGLLVADPADLDAFAAAVTRLLRDAELARRLGENARARVAERYLAIDALLRYGALIEQLDR